MGDCWWSAAASIVLGRLPFAEQGMSRRTVPYTAPTEKGSNVRDAMHGLERVATRGTTGALVRGRPFRSNGNSSLPNDVVPREVFLDIHH